MLYTSSKKVYVSSDRPSIPIYKISYTFPFPIKNPSITSDRAWLLPAVRVPGPTGASPGAPGRQAED